MAKYTQRVHTLDLTHKPTVVKLLNHLRNDRAKVVMFNELETSHTIISVVTKYRNKDGEK
jgi:hypothetical protein